MKRLKSMIRKWLGIEHIHEAFRWGVNVEGQSMVNQWVLDKMMQESLAESRAKRAHEEAVIELVAKSKKRAA